MKITVVTITNRKRWHLLEKTIGAAVSQGASDVLVVDNESQEDITALMNQAFPGLHRTLRIEPNQGSSGAYYYGIKAAVEGGAEFILLLDDDNVLMPGALDSIKHTYNLHRLDIPTQFLCVTGMRMDQEALRGDIPEPTFPSNERFLGFSAWHLLSKSWKQLPWFRGARMRKTFAPPKEPVERKLAPFGGMFFHRSVVELFGYPDPRFVLYCDDVEFTHRIVTGGGRIWFDPNAEIDDIDLSWHTTATKLIYFERWIKLGTDEQVYHELRNKAYLETHARPRLWRREFHRFVLILILWYLALRAGKLDRFRLILRAIKEGESGRLQGRTVERVFDSGPPSAEAKRNHRLDEVKQELSRDHSEPFLSNSPGPVRQ